MVLASQLRPGTAIRHEGQIYRVIASEYHPGQGKMGGATRVRLQNTSTAAFWEHSFRAELKLEVVPVEKQHLEYLYSDADQHYFMSPESYEQIGIAGIRADGAVTVHADLRRGIAHPPDLAAGPKGGHCRRRQDCKDRREVNEGHQPAGGG